MVLHGVKGCYTVLEGVTLCYMCCRVLYGVTRCKGCYTVLEGVTLCYMCCRVLHGVTRC